MALNMAGIDAMDPACIEVEEVEDNVADVRNGEHVEIARHVRRQANRNRLNAKSVHMALVGAPFLFTLPKYFGSQPSFEP